MRSVLIATLAGLLVLPQLAAADTERRSEALQLYQEGLFQETGTGDLAMARRVYSSILENYNDYRDVSAVVLYHLGLVQEKLGDYAAAESCFRKIIIGYVDQTAVVQKATFKLSQVIQERSLPPGQVKLQAEKETDLLLPAVAPTPAATPMAAATPQPAKTPVAVAAAVKTPTPKATPAAKAQKDKPGYLGIGANLVGMQVRYLIPGKNILLEAKGQILDDGWLAGGRCALYFVPRSWYATLSPYVGVEYDLVQRNDTGSGYRIGGCAGLEIFLGWHIGFAADCGYYYRNLPTGSGDRTIDNQLAGNAYFTYYF
jgi:hypothetical protein